MKEATLRTIDKLLNINIDDLDDVSHYEILHNQVKTILKKEDNNLLNDIDDIVYEKYGEDGVKLLEDVLDYEMSHVIKTGVVYNNKPHILVTQIFFSPIIFTNKNTLSKIPDYNYILQRSREHKLINNNEAVYLMPNLYSLNDINSFSPISLFKSCELMSEFYACYNSDVDKSNHYLKENYKLLKSKSSNDKIKYMISYKFSFIKLNNENSLYELLNQDYDTTNIFYWQKDIINSFKNVLKTKEDINVFYFDRYYQSLQLLLNFLNDYNLIYHLRKIKSDNLNEEIQAIILENDNFLNIEFYKKNKLIKTINYKIIDNIDTSFSFLMETIEQYNFKINK